MIPKYQDKYGKDSLFSASHFVEFMKKAGRNMQELPEHAIIIFQKNIYYQLKKRDDIVEIDRGTLIYDDRVVIRGDFGIGAPAMGAEMEELIVRGVKNIIGMGFAGGLQKDLSIGDIIICDKAIRDEGTSYHYVPHGLFSYATSTVIDSMSTYMKQKGITFKIGPGWTTDAPYRETKEEVNMYAKDGILTVDMEASALFAIGAAKNINVGALFLISDLLVEGNWKPDFKADLLTLFDVSSNALLDLGL